MNTTQKTRAVSGLGFLSKLKVNLSWQQIGFVGTLALSAILNFYSLGENGYTNEYYAAAVKSQLVSWHNFFFNAYDPGGFITLDKPPVAFWLETISAWVLGFSGVSILVPSALAGVASVALIYHLVARTFGPSAGLISAFVLAITPISVIMNRHNNPESLLILALLLGAWAIIIATEKGQLGWLLLAVTMVGVGFNIKMLQAFVILPVFYALYFLMTSTSWWKRIWHLALATAVLTVVSLSWAIAVDLTPADQRPYIGSSPTNSVINLIVEYNGVGRIEGNEFGGGGGEMPAGFPPFADGAGQPNGGGRNGQPRNGGFPPMGGQLPAGFPPFADGAGFEQFAGNRPGGAGGVIAGQAGALRMFDPNLAGEAGWLLPLALLGLAIGYAQTWRRFAAGKERTQRQRAFILWGGWLVIFMAVFSVAGGIFHSYYLVMLAPAIAALAGASFETLWYSYRQGGWQSFLLPLILLISAVFQFNILSSHTDWNRTIAIAVVVIELVVATALIALPRLLQSTKSGWAIGLVGLGLVGLSLAPFAWSIHSLINKNFLNATLPTAVPVRVGATVNNGVLTLLEANWNVGLSLLAIVVVVLIAVTAFANRATRLNQLMTIATVALTIVLGVSMAASALPQAAAASANTALPSVGMIGNPMMGLSDSTKLISYLEANRAGRTYILATASSQNASDIIIKTGLPVMAMGGFMGADPAITSAAQVADLVKNNVVRYFLLGGMGPMGGGRGGSQTSTTWVTANCKVVDSQLWSSPTAATDNANPMAAFARAAGGAGTLYDCAK